jgi:hypothetical protein
VPDEESAPSLKAEPEPQNTELVPPLIPDVEAPEAEDEEILIAYIKGEPVIGIFGQEEAPFTDELDHPTYSYSKGQNGINRVTKSTHLARFHYGQNNWINVKTSVSQQLAHDSAQAKGEKAKSLDDLLPKAYQEYRTVFEKVASEHCPESRPWDHAIDLKPDFIPKDCKVYPLTPAEQVKLDKFIEENIKKGYIRPSKSPMASPFFFVVKKDTDALRPCQDYRYLNDRTMKNVYPLPLVSNLLDKLKGAKIFTKLDIRWGYHNV